MIRMSNGISPQDVSESERILQRANENNVTLRLVGGLAIREHCSEIAFCERRYADIDVVGLSNQAHLIVRTFEELEYIEKRSMTISTGGTRLLFEKPDSMVHHTRLDELRRYLSPRLLEINIQNMR